MHVFCLCFLATSLDSSHSVLIRQKVNYVVLIMILSNNSTVYLEKCNGSFLEEFSDFCLTLNNSFAAQCFPSEKIVLRYGVGVWSIIFGIVGFD